MSVLMRLEEIFRGVFDDPDIVLSSSTCAKDIIDWDSVKHIHLLLEIEEAFQVTFTTEEVFGLENVGQFVELLEQKLQKR